MATIYGALNPPNAVTYAGSSQLGGTHTGADGDIFVRTSGVNPQWRFSVQPAPVWTPIVPPLVGTARTTESDTRADVLPRAGQPNDRLAKVGAPARAWEVGWANAASGIVTVPLDQPSSQTWVLLHDLGQRWVDVTVISPGHTNPNAEQKLVFPTVEYIDETACRLAFMEPVAGTAIIRR